MSEIIIERLKESLDKTVKIFLNNGFRYEGRILNCDEKYVEILDFRSNAYKVILIIDIKDIEISIENQGVDND